MEQKLLKKGKKIKIGDENFIVEDFKDEENFDKELNEGTKNREISIRNEDEDNPKFVRQKIFLKKGDNSRQAGIYREMSSASKFKNRFSFQSKKAFIGKSIIKLKGEKNERSNR